MKTAGIGCGVFVVMAMVLALALPTDVGASAIAYAAVLSIPLFIAGAFIKAYENFKWPI